MGKKVFAPKCLQGRPYYLTHDKFVRPCCYFSDHGWEPNSPPMEGGRGPNEWPINHVKWLRDSVTNLNNYNNINEVFESTLYKNFFKSLQKPIVDDDVSHLPKRCLHKCYTERPNSLGTQAKYKTDAETGNTSRLKDGAWNIRDPYLNVDGVFKGSRKIQLDATHRCRLGCPKCSRFISDGPNKGQRREVLQDELTVDDIAKIVGDGMQYRNYDFCGSVGDAIYNPQFIDIVKYIRKHTKDPSLQIYLHTNGSGKKAEWWKELYSALDPVHDEIIFGVDGLEDTAHLYRKYIRFNESIEAMRLGAEYGFTRSSWQFIVFKFNEHQVEDAKKLANEIGIRLVLVKSDRWEGINDPLMPSKEWLPEHIIERFGL